MRMLLLSPGFKAKIIQLNLKQHAEGIDADGKLLRSGAISALINDTAYASYTIFLKEQRGQPTDVVTLKDKGDFYRSHNVFLQGNYFVITADTLKGDDDLLEVWGDHILGLTDESLQIIIDIAYEIIQKWVIEFLLS